MVPTRTRRINGIGAAALVVSMFTACTIGPVEGDRPGGPCEPKEEIPYDGVDQDCTGADLTDVDGDGFKADTVGGRDCDDSDPAISPAAIDEPYDGVDQDCSGSDLSDVDNDGYDSVVVGGLDCDDYNDGISPAASEVPYDGVDQDCSGADLTDVDGDGYDATDVGGSDCDDVRSEAHPGAAELCNGLDDNCDGLGDDLQVGTTHDTIQGAIDAACATATILVPPGRYAGGLRLGRSNSLRGTGTSPNDVVIDGSTCVGTSTSCTGIAVRRAGEKGAAVLLSNLRVEQCALGGITVVDSFATIKGVVFAENDGQGGLVAWSSIDSAETLQVTVDACEFRNNSTSDRGGGLHVNTPFAATISRSTFVGNSAAKTGGGADIYKGIAVNDCTFRDNEVVGPSGWTGGGLAIRLDHDLQLINRNVFEGNDAPYCPSLAYSRAAKGILPTSNEFRDGRDEEYGPCF